MSDGGGGPYAIGRGLAGIAHSVVRVRRSLVIAQLAASFPNRDAAWVRRVARDCYRHFGEEFLTLAAGRGPVERAIARVRGVDDVVDDLYRLAGGSAAAVIVTGHLGNWEVAGAYLASAGVPITAVARRQRGFIGRRAHEVRESLGLQIVDHDAGVKPLLRALRDGRCLTLVADQHAWRGSEPIDFFGRPAWTTLGPARLARAAGVPLIFGAAVRDDPGYVGIWKRVDADLVEDSPVTATESWVSYLQDAVTERPEQYFWFHKRWKNTGRSVVTA